MMRPMKINYATALLHGLIACLLSIAVDCSADTNCKALAERATKSNGMNDFDILACKPMPNVREQTIIILRDKILMVDSGDGQILSQGGL
jgi:hypothetical protein